jgi:capsular polysaccharide biosynthesis protein
VTTVPTQYGQSTPNGQARVPQPSVYRAEVGGPKSSDSGPLRRSLVIAVVLGLVVLVGGFVYAVTKTATYQANTQLVVLPTNTLTTADQSQYFSTLGNGQVVPTMAELAKDGRFETEAEQALGLSTKEAAASSVTISTATDTSVLVVNADADNAKVAEDLADRTAALAAAYLHKTFPAYTATPVRSAQGTAASAGASKSIVLLGSVVAALAVAVAAQQASYPLLQARRVRRQRRPLTQVTT